MNFHFSNMATEADEFQDAISSAAARPAAFTFEPFNAATSKFDRWLERLEISFRIYKVTDADKRDYLLHYMGGATYDVLCNKLKNESPDTSAPHRWRYWRILSSAVASNRSMRH